MSRVLGLLLALMTLASAFGQTPRADAPVIEDGPLRVRVWPDKWETTPVADVALTIETEVATGWAVESAMLDLAPGDSIGGMTVSAVAPDRVERVGDDRLRTTRVLTLSPGLPGAATLGGHRFTARRAGGDESVSVRSAPVELTVSSLLAEAGDTFTPGALRAPLDPEPSAPFAKYPWLLPVLAGSSLAFVAGGALATIIVRRRLANSAESRLRRLRAELDALAHAGVDARTAALAADEFSRRALAMTVLPGASAMTSQEIMATTRSWQGQTALAAAIATVLDGVERAVFAGDDSVNADDLLEQARRVIDASPLAHTRGEVAA